MVTKSKRTCSSTGRRRKPRAKRTGEFRSGLEQNIFSQLKSLIGRSKKKTITYEEEKLHYYVPKNYVPDFVVTKADGSKIYIEVKGYFRPEDQSKMRHVKNCNPELDIRFVFARDQKLYRSKMSYSDWCKKYSFPCAFGVVPKEWMK